MRTFMIFAVLLITGAAVAAAQTDAKPAAQPASPVAAAATAQKAKSEKPQGETPQSDKLKIDPQKAADIRRLLDTNGAKLAMVQSIEGQMKTIRPLLVNAMPPGEYREKLIDLFYAKFQAKLNLEHFIDLAIPIYDKQFSDEEIKGLISFYSTPLGHKSIVVLPTLMSELRQSGEQWGEQLGKDSMQEVLAEHPEMEKAMEDAAKAARQK